MSYNSKYKGSEVESLLDKVDTLEIPDVSGFATKDELSGKVDKVSGKQLSTEDFTSTLKTKLEGLSNYDDTELSEALSTLRGDFDKLVSGDTTTAIKTFNEVIAFLDGVQDTQDLSSIIASIEQQIAGKMDQVTLAKVATTGNYNDLSNKPTIPSAVTESTVSGWGFTKNTGTYSKPSGGIPKTDLASAVQTSLGKADSAIQSIKTINNQSLVGSGNVTIDTNPHYIVTSFTIDSLKTYIEQGVTEGIPFTDLQYVQWAFGSKKPVYVKLSDDESTSMYQMTGAYEDQWYFYILQSHSLYSLEVYDQQTIGFLSVTILPESFKTINGQPIIGTGNIEIEGSNNQPDIYVTRFTMEELWEGLIYAQENVESYFELDIDGQGLTEAIASHKSILIPRAGYNGYAQVISVQYDQDDYTYLTIVDNTTTIYIGCSSNDLTQGSTLTLTNNYITIETVDSEISPKTIVKRDSYGAISVSGIWDDGGSLWATEFSPEEMQAKADYIFQSKIEDIDDIRTGAALGKTALQSETYKGTITGVSANGTSIATSGVANIPAASTSVYGVTKLSSATNSTSTTLAATPSAVKAAYDLANSYKGTVTGVKINGTTKNPTSGVVDLGTVITAHQTLKTINGQSIIGSGNISISGGSGGSGSGAYPEVNHGTSDTTFTLTPNTFHIWDEVSALTLTLGSETAGVANEFLFQFTSGSESTSLILPDDIKWTNDEAPVIEANKIYQISILKGLGSVLSWSNANTALIENHITYDAGNFMDGGTIIFEYPTASELTFSMSYYQGNTLIVPQGSTQVNVDWNEPTAPAIRSFSPPEDSTYKYILR